MQDVKVASVQFNHKRDDKPYNLEVISDFVERASLQNVDIICFPEMCISGYWHVRNLNRSEIETLAEPVPSGDSLSILAGIGQKIPDECRCRPD